ncbi:MAG: hypothetical protein LBE09_02650, partial [Christensenellaceae bacterium]|nr:hypothetical protein [Christensenellaceae bacterium]
STNDAFLGTIIGLTEDGVEESNCYYVSELSEASKAVINLTGQMVTEGDLTSAEWIRTNLKWDEEIWNFETEESEYPLLRP